VSRRVEILKEMGIWPIWVLRDRGRAPRREEARPAPSAGESLRAEPALPLSRSERIARMDWTELEAAVRGCNDCALRAGCTQTVFGVGDRKADWLVVGEAPGAEEDRLGEPFVGQAGKLLDNMLAAIGLARGANVYIANVIKCRPPGNRNPAPEEVAACAPYLARQIALIGPKLILAMGRFAVQALLGTEASIASLRGRVHRYRDVPVVVTYHPAYLLRNLPDKAKAWVDLVLARRTISASRQSAT